MIQIVLNEEQVKQLRLAVGTVELCDTHGKVVALLDLPLSPEEIEELKRRARSPGPWFTGEQVQARLRALQEEWDRTRGFDESYLKQYLDQLDAADPGHMEPQEPAA
jgi:hypothetical protein